MTWNTHREETLMRLWRADMPPVQIAEELGGFELHADGGRAEIIRKVNELSRSGGPKKPVRAPPRAAAPKSPVDNVFDIDGSEAVDNADALDAATPMEQRRTLLELTSETCRWPVGEPRDPSFFFCGGGVVPGTPYCGRHCRRAYSPRTAHRAMARATA